jgi:hypothetical protein
MVVYTAVIPALGWLRQEDHGFEASLGYTARPFLKIKQRGEDRVITRGGVELRWALF